MNTDSALAQALAAHPPVANTVEGIPSLLCGNWAQGRALDLSPNQQSVYLKPMLLFLIQWGGPGGTALANAADQLALTTIANRALDRYNAMFKQNPLHAKILAELKAAQQNDGDIF